MLLAATPTIGRDKAEVAGLLLVRMPDLVMVGGCISATTAIMGPGLLTGFSRLTVSNRATCRRRSFHSMPQIKIRREVSSFARKGLSTRRVSFADRSVRCRSYQF